MSLKRGKAVLLGFLFLLRVLAVWTSELPNGLLSLSIRLNVEDTMVSPSRHFELGIFPFQQKYYLCIQYKNPIERVITWIANRNTPLVSSDSYLRLSSPDGILQLFDPATHPNKPSWTSNIAKAGAVGNSAMLLDTGNLVLDDTNGVRIWESFNDSLSLTDTLLPGQIYNKDKGSLVSWKTKDDPGTGNGTYTFGWGTRANVSILQLAWTSPKPFMKWAGGAYVPAPLLDESSPRIYANIDHVYVHDKLGHLYIPSSPPSTPAPTAILKGGDELSATTLKRITMDIDGSLRIWQWTVGTSKTWKAVANWVVAERQTQCTVFGTCGQFGMCTSPLFSLDRVQCSCPKGFKPIYNDDVARGCVHKVPVLDKPDCNDTAKVTVLVLSDADAPWSGDYKNFTGNDRAKCADECLKDCDCAGATYGPDNATSEINYCWMKTAPLYNLGYPTKIIHGLDRVAFLKVSTYQPAEPSVAHKKVPLGAIIGAVLGGVIVVGLLTFCICRRWDSLRRICKGVWSRQYTTRPEEHIPDFKGPNAAPPETLVLGSNRGRET